MHSESKTTLKVYTETRYLSIGQLDINGIMTGKRRLTRGQRIRASHRRKAIKSTPILHSEQESEEDYEQKREKLAEGYNEINAFRFPYTRRLSYGPVKTLTAYIDDDDSVPLIPGGFPSWPQWTNIQASQGVAVGRMKAHKGIAYEECLDNGYYAVGNADVLLCTQDSPPWFRLRCPTLPDDLSANNPNIVWYDSCVEHEERLQRLIETVEDDIQLLEARLDDFHTEMVEFRCDVRTWESDTLYPFIKSEHPEILDKDFLDPDFHETYKTWVNRENIMDRNSQRHPTGDTTWKSNAWKTETREPIYDYQMAEVTRDGWMPYAITIPAYHQMLSDILQGLQSQVQTMSYPEQEPAPLDIQKSIPDSLQGPQSQVQAKGGAGQQLALLDTPKSLSDTLQGPQSQVQAEDGPEKHPAPLDTPKSLSDTLQGPHRQLQPNSDAEQHSTPHKQTGSLPDIPEYRTTFNDEGNMSMVNQRKRRLVLSPTSSPTSDSVAPGVPLPRFPPIGNRTDYAKWCHTRHEHWAAEHATMNNYPGLQHISSVDLDTSPDTWPDELLHLKHNLRVPNNTDVHPWGPPWTIISKLTPPELSCWRWSSIMSCLLYEMESAYFENTSLATKPLSQWNLGTQMLRLLERRGFDTHKAP